MCFGHMEVSAPCLLCVMHVPAVQQGDGCTEGTGIARRGMRKRLDRWVVAPRIGLYPSWTEAPLHALHGFLAFTRNPRHRRSRLVPARPATSSFAR